MKMKDIATFVDKHCQADDYTLYIVKSENLYTRFAQNAITQHIDGENLQLSLNVAYDNKTGSAAVNQTDENSLKKMIDTAQSIARLNKPDPEFVPSEKAHKLRELEEPSKATTELKLEHIVDGIEKCIENAKRKQAKLAGISHRRIKSTFLATKNGFEGYDRQAYFSHSMTMKKGGIETKIARSLCDYDVFSMDDLITQLNGQFDSLQEPQKLEPTRLPVIIRPQALLSVLKYLVWTFQRREADEGANAFSDQIGKRFFGENFSMRSVTTDAQLHAPRFDNDGIPTQGIDWIEHGVIKNMQTDRSYAKKIGIEPRSIYNLSIEGGNMSEQEMMRKVERGLIINSFWYIRPIDMKAGEWTGLTRDGVLYFEDGKVKQAVYNFRWNEVLHDLTRRILAVGKQEQIEYDAKVPTLLCDDFNLVDVTTF